MSSWYDEVVAEEAQSTELNKFCDARENGSVEGENPFAMPTYVEENLEEFAPKEIRDEFSSFKSLISNILDKFNLEISLKITIISQIISFIICIINNYKDGFRARFSKILIFNQIIGILSALIGAFGSKFTKKDLMDFEMIYNFENVEKDDNNPYLKHLAFLNTNCHSRVAILDYIANHQLTSKFKIPSVSFEELEKGDKNSNWIFETYSSSFISAWYSRSYYKVDQLRNKYISNFKRQSKYMEATFELVQRFFFICMCWIQSKLFGREFSRQDIKDGVFFGKEFSSCTGDLFKDLLKFGNKDDEIFNQQVETYTKEINDFMEIPLYEFSGNLRKLYDIRDTLDSIAQFIRTCPKDKSSCLFPLQGLHTAATKRKNDILSSSLPEFKRQEPFVLLLHGNGAIGKTHFAQYFCSKFVKEVLSDGNPAKDYIEIRHDDKYWPPLSGQRVAFFDEAGTVSNLDNDLLFHNIKGICSTAYFNCPSADIEHKVTPCPFQFIVASTNTSLIDLQARFAKTFSQESVYPIWRRCIVVDCSWNETLCGKLDLNDPSGHRTDYKHLKMTRMIWDQTKAKLEPDRDMEPDDIFRTCITRFRKFEQEHQRSINMRYTLKQSNHKVHYSLHLHGKPGHGKTPNILSVSKDLSNAFRMERVMCNDLNVLAQTRFSDVPRIFVFDDVFDMETSSRKFQLFMHVYNNVLPNNSMLIFGSNIRTTYKYIPSINITEFYYKRILDIPISGALRRLGFTGNFSKIDEMPGYNSELYCRNGTFYECKQTYHKIYSCLLINLCILFVAFYNPIFSFGFLYNFTFKKHTREVIPNLKEYVFNRYKQFVEMRGNVLIEEVDELPDIEYTYKLFVPNIDEFKVIDNIRDLDIHLTMDPNLYNQTTKEWIMYVHPELANSLRSVYNKFFINNSRLTRTLVISELTRCAKTMLEYGIRPCIFLEINSIGKFSYVDNKIFILKENQNFTSCAEIYATYDSIVINSLEPITIPFSDLFTKVNIPLKYDLSLQHSLEFSRYIKSNEFLSQPHVIKFLTLRQKELVQSYMQLKIKAFKDKFFAFTHLPIGKFSNCIYMMLFTFITTYLASKMIMNVVSWLLKSDKRKDYDSDSSDNDDYYWQRKGDKKKRINPKYDSDNDRRQRKGDKRKKINPKYDSDNEQPRSKQFSDLVSSRQGLVKRQDVKTLVDMNSYDGYKKYMQNAYDKAKHALNMVYICQSGIEVLDKEPRDQQACYGIFVFKNVFVTVGHIVNEMKRSPYYNLYVGHDKFQGKFYKCTLLRSYKHRDISVWKCNSPIQFPDITSSFINRNEIYTNDFINACFQRYATKKEEQWLQGSCSIIEPFYNLDKDGIQEFGYIDFSTFEVQLTYYGDCGLPYYAIERTRYHDKILGIHCMGNETGYSSVGILSLLYREDLLEWKCDYQQNCKFCGNEEVVISPSITPKCDLHEIAWSATHDSSPQTFVEELRSYTQIRPNFNGLIIKNSGPVLMGSQTHSHTQFLSGIIDDNIKVTSGWKTTTASELGFDSPNINPNQTISYRVVDISYGSLFNALNNIGFAKNFRLRANVYNAGSKRKAITMVMIPLEEMPSKLDNQILEYSRQVTVPLTIMDGQEVHVSGDVFDICQQHRHRLRRGMLPDVPFENIEDNNTVEVFGVAHRNMSPLPAGIYHPTPFHMDIGEKAGEYKSPVRFDAHNAPLEIKELLACDRSGNPDGRITASLEWAHINHSPPIDLRIYCRKQYLANILQYYAGLELLTDEQVLRGYSENHRLRGSLNGLELDSSIGWTMKQIFDVQKKSDVISKDLLGNYTWADNDASEFSQYLFKLSCEQSQRGERYWTSFLELLKMEKLKPSKQFTPRSFTANDLNGILMERRILGEFSARAMSWDKEVGVGLNPYTNFDKLFRHLAVNKNIFTIDYKRFDRTLPECVFNDMRDLLKEANPNIANDIDVCFNTFTRRLQISGNTLFTVRGGMPSGCLVTAPLNSKLNDLIIFTAYVAICWENNRDEISTYICYDRRVKRIFYGDDVFITVSDDISDIFNSITVAKIVKRLFGMNITPSSKQGELKPFETWDEASFISRFFRKLDKYPFYVGALKKISIATHFHWTVDLDPKQISDQLTIAQMEAALWDSQYFIQIQDCIRIAINKQPAISKYFSFRSRLDIQRQIFDDAFQAGLILQDACDIPVTLLEAPVSQEETNSWYEEVVAEEAKSNVIPVQTDVPEVLQKERKQENPDFIRSRESILFKRIYSSYINQHTNKRSIKDYNRFKKYIAKLSDNIVLEENFKTEKQKETFLRMSSFSKINELFQSGEILKPLVSFSRYMEEWSCEISSEYVQTGRMIFGTGLGTSKACSREEASEAFLADLFKDKVDKVQIMVRQTKLCRQMNVSKGAEHATPGAPLIAPDPSIAPDTGIATNTMTVSPVRVINPLAQALDNPAGTGAAFDKKDSIYGIYSRWTSKNAVINGSLPQGSEVFRISLNPQELPLKIREYIMFHDAIIPQIDVQILIGGAAGSIGWLKLGWVPDDSKTYTLDDLQLVASETVNLNNTLTMCTILNDNRRAGLYRLVNKDPEPWPALILMVEHPALNVQRNDDVNYPVFVNVRLGPNCVLMQPYNQITDGLDFTNRLNLAGFLAIRNVDLLIGTNLVTDPLIDSNSYPDCGWNTSNFVPTFTLQNLCMVQMTNTPGKVLAFAGGFPSLPKDIAWTNEYPNYYRPVRYYFAYGSVPTTVSNKIVYRGGDPSFQSTVYAIPKFKISIGGYKLQCTVVHVYEFGCIMVFENDENSDLFAGTFKGNTGQITARGGGLPDQYSLTQNYTGEWMSFQNPIGFKSGVGSVYSVTDKQGGTSENFFQNRLPAERVYDFRDIIELIPGKSEDRFYQFTFVQTGNSTPSSALPGGLRGCAIVRPGTTSTQKDEAAFTPLVAPALKGAYSALDDICTRLKTDFIQFDVLVEGRIFTKLAYGSQTFICRTGRSRMIRNALSTNIMLDNITPIDNVNTLPQVPLEGFVSWTTNSSNVNFIERFRGIQFQRQSAALMGISAAGGLFNGLANTMQFMEYNKWRDQYQERYLSTLKQLEDIKGQNQINLSKQNFQQKMELLGANSNSAQSGNLASISPNEYQNGNVNRPPADAPKTVDVQSRPLPAVPESDYSGSHLYEEIGNASANSDNMINNNLYNSRKQAPPLPQRSIVTEDIGTDATQDDNGRALRQFDFAVNQRINQHAQTEKGFNDLAMQRSNIEKANNIAFDNLARDRSASQLPTSILQHPQGWGNVVGELKSAQMSGKTII